MDYGKIELTIVYNRRELDVCVSKSLTWLRLEELLRDQMIRTRLKLPSNHPLRFKIKNKQIHIEKQELLAAYPIGDGDCLEIAE